MGPDSRGVAVMWLAAMVLYPLGLIMAMPLVANWAMGIQDAMGQARVLEASGLADFYAFSALLTFLIVGVAATLLARLPHVHELWPVGFIWAAFLSILSVIITFSAALRPQDAIPAAHGRVLVNLAGGLAWWLVLRLRPWRGRAGIEQALPAGGGKV